MYILVDKKEVKDQAYHRTMPDGRVILPLGSLKTMGSMTNVDIITSSTELKALIQEQKASGLYNRPSYTPDSGGITEDANGGNPDSGTSSPGADDSTVEDAVVIPPTDEGSTDGTVENTTEGETTEEVQEEVQEEAQEEAPEEGTDTGATEDNDINL